MIEGAELNVYFENGENATLDLTPLQLKTILVALGLSFTSETSYRCISDQALPGIINLLQQKVKIITTE